MNAETKLSNQMRHSVITAQTNYIKVNNTDTKEDKDILKSVGDTVSDVIAQVESLQEESKDEHKWILDYVLKQI